MIGSPLSLTEFLNDQFENKSRANLFGIKAGVF
jgi:hypothetical protein